MAPKADTVSLERELKNYIAKKEMYFAKIQRIFDYTKNLGNEATLNNFKAEFNTVDKALNDLKFTLDEINRINLILDDEYMPSFQVLDMAEQLCGHIQEAHNTIKFRNNEGNQNHTLHAKAEPRLPKIDIIEFHGDKKQWPLFYETFRSLIHNNKQLDDTSKIHYLLGSLKGKALDICAGITPTATNYGILWTMLKERFEDKRLLANTYLTQIMEFKTAQNESASCLNAFLEKFDTAVNSLRHLQIEDLSDYMLVFIALSKLDSQTHKFFEMSRTSSNLPKYGELVEFVKNQSKMLVHTSKISSSSASRSNSYSGNFSKSHSSINKSKFTQSFVANNSTNQKFSGSSNANSSCCICGQIHSVSRCSNFLKLSPSERYKLVKEKYLCLNCLSSKHKIPDCRSVNSCSTCQKRHHSLLHFDKPRLSNAVGNGGSEAQGTGSLPNSESLSEEHTNDRNIVQNFCSTSSSNFPQNNFTTLLSTIVVNIFSASGEMRQARFLLDSGSQSHFISSKLCQKLRLPIQKGHLSVLGIGTSTQPVKGQVDIIITSRFNLNIRFEVSALVVEKITDAVPTSLVKIEHLKYLNNLLLADDKFYKPGEIDGIIGAELFPHIIGSNKIMGPPNMPIAIQTNLGFVVMGKAPIIDDSEKTYTFCATVKPISIEKMLEKFWEIEEVAAPSVLNQEDVECENIFTSTTTRGENGRYTVALPFKENPPKLGNSLDNAVRRFYFLEKKLEAQPLFRENYSKVIRDYLDQGHMTLVKNSDIMETAYYIPHFAVVKNSVSTPHRIVYDCSVKSSNSRSLNDVLYSGPKLQTDILTILLNFRLFEIAMISDVRQMYRNIWVQPDHRRYQRILWRFSPNEPLDTYQLNTVTFGLKPAPFLALRTIQQLATDEAENYPLAAKVVKTDIYVDDVACSVSSLDEARALYFELVGLFKAGGFELLKWSTNSKELWQEIPQNSKLSQAVEFTDTSEINTSLKVLGLQWNPVLDQFSFVVNIPDKKCTKRNILSTIARIWDPLGFLSAVTIYAKLLIKELWIEKIDWDEKPPLRIEKLWIEFYRELPFLEKFHVPRYIGVVKNAQISIVGFSDASSKALAAMVYIKIVTSHNRVVVNLLCAKSKVAPIKTLTIPKLELCAAFLLAKLLKFVIDSCSSRISLNSVIACTDSTVVLNWIKNSPHKWKTFVANRVAKIQSLLETTIWYHIEGKDNPADCLSRGMTPARLVEHSTWVSGPTWLEKSQDEWPIRQTVENSFPMPEEISVMVLPAIIVEEDEPLRNLTLRISSWTKLRRITVYILKFLKILPRNKLIVASDLDKAECILIRSVQKAHFSSEIKLLKSGKICSNALRHLSLFMDNEGLLRVGGRLGRAPLDYDQQHPYLLPKNDHLVNCLIDYFHNKNLHTGPHLLISLLRQKYWILSARNIVRKRIKMCNFCFRFRPKAITPSMADLPKSRVTEAKAFLECGVDFAGPLYITLGRRRGVKSQKAYICLFVCLVTKAIHIELASDLTTATFLNCFKRFLARRGPCSTMYSDCGTNFIGAKSELREIYKFIQSTDYVNSLEDYLNSYNIKWKFNPPSAPHFGGIWESNIKSVKTHLFKVIGSQILTYEELSTVLVQIEVLLNSRPLCWLSSDPAEPLALTPAHFLTLTPLRSLPALDVSDQNLNLLTRKQLLDSIVQSYWKRWRLEYLNSLQSRQKWNTPACPARTGMLVIIQQDNSPPLHWPLGIIEELFYGNDGISRVALVRTKHGSYKRPVVRLCPLPNQ